MTREQWLAVRDTDRRALRDRICGIVRRMPSGGKSRDGGGWLKLPRIKPLVRATGPGSYSEASPQQLLKLLNHARLARQSVYL